jgi:hypothetical protein
MPPMAIGQQRNSTHGRVNVGFHIGRDQWTPAPGSPDDVDEVLNESSAHG